MDLEQVRLETEEFERQGDFCSYVLDELNDVICSLYLDFGWREDIKKLVVLFYKVKIEYQQRGLRLMEKEKNLSVETSTSAHVIERYARQQLEHERAKKELQDFLDRGVLPDF
jgi:hypothetical protein